MVFLRLYLLLYADDTILLAENPYELQAALHGIHHYCTNWELEINTQKTKIMIFSKGKVRNIPEFVYDNRNIEVVFTFRYLGIDLNYNGKFTVCKKHLYNQAQKAMYSVLRKSRKKGLPIDLQLQLFDNVVLPILLYGAEVWGHENNEMIEKLHLKYCRILLNVNRYTARCMIYGELGRNPIQLYVDQRMLCYWVKIINAKDGKLNKSLYQVILALHKMGALVSPWNSKIKGMLNDCQMYHYWLQQRVPGNIVVKIKDVITNQYVEQWKQNVFNSEKCFNYRLFKKELVLERYLLLLPPALRIPLTRFRVVNHKLPIEKGRYENIPRHERKCTHCNVLGDEFHFLFQCITFNNERKLFLSRYYSTNTNTVKYGALFSSINYKKLCKLAKFVKRIMSEFR